MENYEIIGRLGRGAYGSVCRAKRKSDGNIVAIKEIDYGKLGSKKEKQMLVNEVNLLRKLHSKYVVRYINHIVDKEKKFIYLVMEYCDGGDLQTVIRNFRACRSHISEDIIWTTATCVALALKDCHYGPNKIIHRDIKPGNIFIDDAGLSKLGDFGLARTINEELAKTYAGTPPYMSPELIDGHPYDEKSDIWAFGCVLYELANLNPPFMGSGPILKERITKDSIKRIPEMYSDSLMNLILMCLVRDPANRPTILEILEYRTLKTTIKMLELKVKRKYYLEETNKLRNRKMALMKELNHYQEIIHPDRVKINLPDI